MVDNKSKHPSFDIDENISLVKMNNKILVLCTLITLFGASVAQW